MTSTSTTTVHSKRTVTDKICDQVIRRLMKRLEVDYEKAFPHLPAGEEFFERLDAIGGKLQVRLAKRPISKAEIHAAGEKVFKYLRAAIREETKKAAQPRYRERIALTTGEVTLMPDYGE